MDERIMIVIDEELAEAKRRIMARLEDIPFDDEPYPEEQRRQDAQAIAEFERGDVLSFDDLKREYGL